MRMLHCALVGICAAGGLAVDSHNNPQPEAAEALEKRLLHIEDALMANHLAEEGFKVYSPKWASE